MQIVILVGLLIALTLQDGCSSAIPVIAAGPALLAYLLGAGILSGVDAALSVRALRRPGGSTARAVRRHNVVSLATRVWLLAGLAGVMLFGYGRWLHETLGGLPIPLLDEAAAAAPLLAGVLLVWLLDYRFHLAMRQDFAARRAQADPFGEPSAAIRAWSHREYLAYNLRHQVLFVLAPVGLILLARDCLLLFVYPRLEEQVAGLVLATGMLLAAGGVFLAAPLLIVRIWKTRRLAGGELREALEEMSRRLGLAYRDILVWESGGIVVNAGVVGLIAPVRYVLLSDGLIEHLDRRDVRVIFAHEAGHIIHHHILYAAMFAVGSIALIATGMDAVRLWLQLSEGWAEALTLAVLLPTWGMTFGWLSRCFERQSDVTAAWASGRTGDGEDPDRITHEGAAMFARALQRVGELNGIPSGQRNWRHGSIARRVSYVLWLGSTSGTRRRDDALVARLKVGLWFLLAAAATAMILDTLLFS